jgi:ABC-type transporter lipoprotein component MlaA
VTPRPLRAGVNNLILNLDEPSTAVNQVVQLKIGRALKTAVRFAINSTLGIAGLIDVASAGGLKRRPADFGQTLGRYGAKPGPYVMVPFLGPSNVRDGFGRLVDTFTDPVGFVIGGIFSSPGGAARFATAGVNWREQNDGTMSAIYGASDPMPLPARPMASGVQPLFRTPRVRPLHCRISDSVFLSQCCKSGSARNIHGSARFVGIDQTPCRGQGEP